MLSIAVMHDPRRRFHPLLLQRLEGAKVSVIDGPGTLWECAQMAWRAVRGDYHFVMHDDVRPCLGFVTQVRAIVLNHRQPLCLWGSRTEKNMPRPGGFLSYVNFVWGGALGMPSCLVPEFLRWCERLDPDWKMDDTRFALWCAATGRRLLVPYPNLVQHDPDRSIARPGKANQRSPSFVEAPGALFWGRPIVDVPGDPEAFLVSRTMHAKDRGRWWL